MPAPRSFDYAVIRVVPHVEREEFFNAGVIVYCLAEDFLRAKVTLDPKRLECFAPAADPEVVREHLEAIPRICAGGPDSGPIGQLPQKDRWHWLVAPRSTIIQMSPAHSGICVERGPDAALEQLFARYVLPLAGQ